MFTVRFACHAHRTAVKYDAMAEVTAFFRWQDGPQLALHLFRILSLGKSQLAADADAMGVADHAARLGVQIAKQQIGGFAAYARDAQKLLQSAGDFATVIGQQHLAA